MSVFGPSFDSELQAAGLNGLKFWWNEGGQYDISELNAGQQKTFQAVVAAHDPKKPAPPAAPASCTKLGLKRAFAEMKVWPKVKEFIAADPDRQDEWDLAIELKLTDHVMTDAIAAFASEGIAIDPVKLAIRANELVA